MLSEGEVGRTALAPELPVLIYDSQCSFCSRWVGRVRAWDKEGAVWYLPLQDARATVISGRQLDALRRAVHLVRPDGVVYAGAAAATVLLGYLPGGRIPRAILNVPAVQWVAARVYAWIARRFGPVGGPTCG
jgi:predicted DCC family thiol-disulfide oxidoreductase YuxK